MLKASIHPPENVDFDFESGSIALSPDGRRLAFLARGSDGKRTIWVRPLDAVAAPSLSGTAGATYPFWSGDSRDLGFFADGKVKRIDADGGAPQTVCNAKYGRGGTWNREGTIVFSAAEHRELYQVPASGGQPIALMKVDPAQQERYGRPCFLPDGKHLLFLARANAPSGAVRSALWVMSLETGERKKLFDADSSVLYASPGYLLFRRATSL